MIEICINKTKICIINVCVYNAKVQRFLTFFSNEKCFFRQCLKQSKKKVIQIAYWLVYNVLCKSKIQWGYIDFFSCVSVSSLQTNNPTIQHYSRFSLGLWSQAMHSFTHSIYSSYLFILVCFLFSNVILKFSEECYKWKISGSSSLYECPWTCKF